VSRAMHRADSCFARRFDKAKCCLALLVEPVSKGLACMVRLNPKILLVG
jgi:hypothetical protein